MRPVETYRDFSQLTIVEQLLMQDFKNLQNEKDFLEKIKNIDLDIIIKFSNNKDFAEFCRRERFKDFWIEKWQSFGSVFSEDKQKPTAFFPHQDNCHFTLLKGAFFYYKAQIYRKFIKYDFSYNEKQFLLEAIKYGSIHAVQRYNQFLYQCIAENKDLTVINKIFKKIIMSCQLEVRNYGSYALMMLCETYVRYCEWLININNHEKAQKAYHAALQCCETAKLKMAVSTCSIYNASLGKGLSHSNSKNIADPEQGGLWVINYLLPKLKSLDVKSSVSATPRD